MIVLYVSFHNKYFFFDIVSAGKDGDIKIKGSGMIKVICFEGLVVDQRPATANAAIFAYCFATDFFPNCLSAKSRYCCQSYKEISCFPVRI
jgi:hypothetical protein